ncbi:MAG: FAD:protein FMN transferase [Pirellula sp.]
MHRIPRRRLLKCSLGAAIASAWCSSSRAWQPFRAADPDAFAVSFPSMGSTIDVRWVAEGTKGDPESVLKRLQEVADMWVDVLSDYQQDSQCMAFCRQADGLDWVEPPAPLWRMIVECDRWHRLSEGAFDAALGALTRLRRKERPGTESEWQSARERCGWELLEIDTEGHRVRFERSGVRLDFGAIGKGFVIDRLGEALRAMGIERFVANASGNMLCGEPVGREDRPVFAQRDAALETQERPEWHPDSGWPVAIGRINDPEQEMRRMKLARCGISTSGDQFQKFRDRPGDAPQQRTSHIVDPIQRRGLDRACMASVITNSAADADALSTAGCVHLQRGSMHAWLERNADALPMAEWNLQSQPDRSSPIRWTSVYCDW